MDMKTKKMKREHLDMKTKKMKREHLDMKTKKNNTIKLYFENFDLLQCTHYIAVSRIFVICSKTVNFR